MLDQALHLAPHTLAALLVLASLAAASRRLRRRRRGRSYAVGVVPPPVGVAPMPAPASAGPEAELRALRARVVELEQVIEAHQKFANEACVAARMHGTAVDAALVRLQDAELGDTDRSLLGRGPVALREPLPYPDPSAGRR